jgi:hypothetical protein
MASCVVVVVVVVMSMRVVVMVGGACCVGTMHLWWGRFCLKNQTLFDDGIGHRNLHFAVSRELSVSLLSFEK